MTTGSAATTADSTGRAAAQDAAARSGGAAGSRDAAGLSCGGMSFSAGTKVLTASGALVAISRLAKGQKVAAADIRTGQDQAGTVVAVLVHHDTNLYDLKVRAGAGTAVIATTSSHPFWDATARRWVKAAALKYGAHLRTPGGGTATALGGWVPRARTGWMWDLTFTQDHDFYVQAATTPILVHNCGDAATEGQALRNARGQFTSAAGGDSPAADAGRSAHVNYEHTLGGRDYVFNTSMPGDTLMRPDAYSLGQRIVRELKPDTPDAIATGWRQVNRYKAYMEELTGDPGTAYVDLYKQ